MVRSILSYLAIASTVSLIATITLLTTSSSLKSLTKSPQSIGDLGYLPPSALRRQNETNHDVGLGRALERSPSGPLSLKRDSNSSSEIILELIQQSEQANNNNSGTQQQQNQQQQNQQQQPEPQQQQPQNELQQQQQTEQTQRQTQQQTPEPPQTNSDKRPSGVIYQYIPPTPINLTARALLPLQFPHLASPSLDNSNSNTSTPTAALCAIVKDSEPYLDEWTDYHIGLGFHTLILIDNSPHHELLPWQIRRRSAGHSVRVLPKPGTHRQMYGYHMCAAEFKDDFTYMAFLDVDEFLVLKKHDTVTEMLAEHLERGALGISWFIFGSGGRKLYGPWPVTKRFVYRDGLEEKERHRSHWHYVKSVVKLSDYGGYPKSPHSIKTDRGKTGSEKAWVDTNGKGNFDSIGASNYDRPVDVAVIHHYKYLSPKEYRWKTCVRKTVDDKVKDCQEKLERGMSPFEGTVFDDSAWQTLKKNVPKYAMYEEFEDFM